MAPALAGRASITLLSASLNSLHDHDQCFLGGEGWSLVALAPVVFLPKTHLIEVLVLVRTAMTAQTSAVPCSTLVLYLSPQSLNHSSILLCVSQ